MKRIKIELSGLMSFTELRKIQIKPNRQKKSIVLCAKEKKKVLGKFLWRRNVNPRQLLLPHVSHRLPLPYLLSHFPAVVSTLSLAM
jgi:hypothetical protein